MEFKAFKTALFGYSKMDVCTYIADMTAEFSKLMLQNNTKHEAELAALQAEIERLTEQNSQLYTQKQQINQVLIDSKAYADELMRQADEDALRRHAENLNAFERERSRVAEYRDRLETLFDSIQTLLVNVSVELGAVNGELRQLSEQGLVAAPAQALSFVEEDEYDGAQEAASDEYDEDSQDPVLQELPGVV